MNAVDTGYEQELIESLGIDDEYEEYVKQHEAELYDSPSAREEHCERLSIIAEITGSYNRRFSFKESETFMETMEGYEAEGYPVRDAAQRAYDHYFVDRGVTFRRSLNHDNNN